jgi:hypothetical protein
VVTTAKKTNKKQKIIYFIFINNKNIKTKEQTTLKVANFLQQKPITATEKNRNKKPT